MSVNSTLAECRWASVKNFNDIAEKILSVKNTFIVHIFYIY